MQKVLSPLQQSRLSYQPKIPRAIEDLLSVEFVKEDRQQSPISPEIQSLFPHMTNQPHYSIRKGAPTKKTAPLRVGVVLSGGQASGGHNVITGLFDALKLLNNESVLLGFSDGPMGILENKSVILTAELLANYRNQGGFDVIGAGRDKIESKEQLSRAEKTVRDLDLDGVVIIGGDDSNTNAAFLAEYFKSVNCKTVVIGVPKTIDGDLKNQDIEISFGFDSACKVYSEIIGNLMSDALSAKKYYYFVKIMGRSASHVALECALQTHPNLTLIGEEIASKRQRLAEVVAEITTLIVTRNASDKDYGVVLIPEGIIEFIPEVNVLISELNVLLAENTDLGDVFLKLSAASLNCFQSFPKEIQEQLLLSRDSHGNVQVSKIETERFLIEMVKQELKKREYKGKFNPQPYFCGYEGRSGLPSNFDSQYCYSLGRVAALLIQAKLSGYMASIKHLSQSIDNWIPCGVPLADMLVIEIRKGKPKAVIQKALVDPTKKPFGVFEQNRAHWALNDCYSSPGPIQFFGPVDLTDSITTTLKLERE